MDDKFYKKDEWDISDESFEANDPSEWVYVDSNDKPITGICENFHFFKEGDPRNNVYLENGKRV